MSRCLIVLMLVLVPAVSFAQSAVEKTVIELENKWAEANRTGDMQAIDALLAPDFIVTDQTGRVGNRASYLAIFTTQRLQTSTASDFKVVTHGDTAVVLALVEGKGTDTSGKPIGFKVRTTDTWVKMPDGKWQCIASAEIGVR